MSRSCSFTGSSAREETGYIFPGPPEGFRIIAPDLRGHGASTNLAATFTFRQASADLRALVDHLGVRRLNAIGISGGGIAWPHVAGAARDLVSAMVIVSAPPYFLEQARALRRLASDTLLPPGEAARMRQRHVHGEDQIAARFAQARGLADHVDDVSFTPPALARIETETLVVFGDRDPFYPVSLALDLRGAIPRSHLWVIPNGGHAPVFGEHAPAFASTTLAFLKGEWSRADAPAA